MYFGFLISVFLPALVPIHSRSLQASNAVILRQAALCCLMIASAPEWRERKKRMGIEVRGETVVSIDKKGWEDSGKRGERMSELGIQI